MLSTYAYVSICTMDADTVGVEHNPLCSSLICDNMHTSCYTQCACTCIHTHRVSKSPDRKRHRSDKKQQHREPRDKEQDKSQGRKQHQNSDDESKRNQEKVARAAKHKRNSSDNRAIDRKERRKRYVCMPDPAQESCRACKSSC